MPTVARGVAAAALLASAWVGLLALQHAWPRGTEPPPRWCDATVEMTTTDGRGQLACVDDAQLRRCGALQAGDRVMLTEGPGAPLCTVQPHGMRAGWRLLRGLPLDVNRATAADLELLDGIGPKTAARIVAYRTRVGGLHELRDLRHVSGIGPKTVAKLSDVLRVDLGSAATALQPQRAKHEGCKAPPRQSIGEKCNVDG